MNESRKSVALFDDPGLSFDVGKNGVHTPVVVAILFAVVADEGFTSRFRQGHAITTGERMFWRHHQSNCSITPASRTVYSYGRLSKESSFSIAGDLLMAKDLILKSFSNFRSTTVRNPLELETALQQLSAMMAMPHFRTKRGMAFEFEKIEDAISYSGEDRKNRF